jgi:hypothetical protein
MNTARSISYASVLGVLFAIAFILPTATQAYVDYGAFYSTPAPNSQTYYQPMYAYAASPVLNNQGPYQQQNQYGYGAPQNQNQYGYSMPQNQYSYGSQNQYIYNNTPINQYQPQYQQQYYPQQYSQQYSYPQYNSYPQYGYSSYPSSSYGSTYGMYGQNSNMYGQNVPYSSGYPTGDTVPWIGGQLCEFPDYDGRALCGSNPNQYIYDPWTGSWY